MKIYKYSINKIFLLLLSFFVSIGFYRLEDMGIASIPDVVTKFSILTLLLILFLLQGIEKKINPPVFAAFICFVLSIFFGNEYFLYLNSFIGFSLGWLLLNIVWHHNSEDILKYTSFISLVSAIAGVILFIGGGEICRQESSGVCRFTGGLVPAHIAFLAFYGVVASCIRIMDYHRGYILLIINFIICIFTFSRMASLLSIISIFVLFLLIIKDSKVHHVKKTFIILFFIPIVGVVVSYSISRFLSRSVSYNSEMIESSGREAAWDIFVEAGFDSPWFGHGFGASLELIERSSSVFISVPHNEYIHYFYDLGFLGVVIIFLSLFYLFRNVIIKIKTPSKPIMLLFSFELLIYSFTDNVLSTIQSTLLIALILKYYMVRNLYEN